MIRFSRTDTLFFIVMAAAGVAAVLAMRTVPEHSTAYLEGYAWPIAAAFIFDLALRGRMSEGSMEPLTMPMRFAGVLFGMILFIIVELATRNGA